MKVWKEEDYKYLCETFDSILLAPDLTVERIAISALHVLNEHPTNLKKYDEIFEGKKFDTLNLIKLNISKALRILRSCSLIFYNRNFFHTIKKADVLIISHLLSEEQLDSDKDFYFGKLPEEMEMHNLSCVVALQNHTGKKINDIALRRISKNNPRLLLENSLPLHLEMDARRQLSNESSRLKNLANKSESEQMRLSFMFAARQAESTATIMNLSLYFQIKRLVETLQPKAIIVTFEGHAWERLAFAAAREVASGIRCIGYQHAILFPRQHAIKRALTPNFDPDVILTAGAVNRDILRKYIPNNLIKIEVAGTHRFKPHNLRKLKEKMHPEMAKCLVVPDGTFSECIKIFDFVFQAAKLAPTLKFIIRTHPVITYEKIATNNSMFKNLPKNVELSTKEINEDFSRCRWAIYRGSGAVIYSVVAGLRPIYLAEKDELSIDPLFELQEWRLIATTPEELIKKIEIDSNCELRNLEFEWKPAREFCLNYFQQHDFDAFAGAIEGT